MAVYNAYTAETYSKKLIELGITTITLIGDYKNTRVPARHHCSVCGGDFDINPDNLMRRKSCPVCTGRRVVVGINDIATTAPHLVRHLADPEDAHRYTAGSQKKIKWKCADCGAEKFAVIQSMRERFKCAQCGDGFSFPEKYMHSVLEQSGINFIWQLNSCHQSWCGDYRYDFYFESGNEKIIVETHGAQHYKMNRPFFGKSNNHIMENDIKKEALAMNNGITQYIKIDCSKSQGAYIKNSIIHSSLYRYLPSDVDWKRCEEVAAKSVVPIIAKLFNEGKAASEIAKELDIEEHAVRKSLIQAESIGLTQYNELKKWNNPSHYSVVHLETGNAYCSLFDASEALDIHPSAISRCCKGKNAVAFTRSGIPTHWKFMNEYDENFDYSDLIAIKKNKAKHERPVICLTTGDVFATAAEGGRWAGVKTVSDALANGRENCGRHPVTGERLKWAYLEV